MSCQQFISNLEGLNNGKDFPKELLKVHPSSFSIIWIFLLIWGECRIPLLLFFAPAGFV